MHSARGRGNTLGDTIQLSSPLTVLWLKIARCLSFSTLVNIILVSLSVSTSSSVCTRSLSDRLDPCGFHFSTDLVSLRGQVSDHQRRDGVVGVAASPGWL